MKTIKWTGTDETLIRKEYGGEAFPVKPGGTIDVQDSVAKELQNLYSDRIEVVEAKTTKAVVEPEAIERASTKKTAKK